MPSFGLIGRSLSHSFSKRYFEEKFAEQGLTDHHYHLWELPEAADFRSLPDQYPDLIGLNVTIPFKKEVIPYLDWISPEATEIGAVNTLLRDKTQWKGFNTDVYGFEKSFFNWIPKEEIPPHIWILGTGGASRAIGYVLQQHRLSYQRVSRSGASKGAISYTELGRQFSEEGNLLINCTPLGMYPDVNEAPPIPYERLSSRDWLYDLVYNPDPTLFLQAGKKRGSATKSGLEMLFLQAHQSWNIWNDTTAFNG